MNKSSFFIAGQHAVIEALRNPKRKVLRVFLTEDAKKNIHRKNPKKNVLEDVKVYFKSKKELDKYTSKEQLMHGGYVAEIEHLDQPDLKEFIKGKKDCTFVCLDEVTEVGGFVELELVVESQEEVEPAKLKLIALADQLGLSGSTRTSYLEMLLKSRESTPADSPTGPRENQQE